MATKKEEKNQTQTDSSEAFDVTNEINELIQALEGDLSTIETESVLSLIGRWYSFLHKSTPEAKELASGLKELQKMLKSGKATGHDISEELIHISEQTTEFSDDAEKDLKQTIQRLGKQLRQAGTSLARAEDREYHQQIDTLLEQAENEKLTSLDAEAAVDAIDFWYSILHKTEGEQFHPVANSLKELKQVLKRGHAKPETVAKALTHVGQETTKVASEVPRGFKGLIQKLGKQLTKAGESLTAK